MFFDGVQPSAQSVKVLVLPEGLRLWMNTGEIADWSYAELRQTQGFYAGQQVRLETSGFPPKALTVSEEGFLDAVHHVGGLRSKHFHRPKQRHWRLPLTVLAGLSIVGMGVWLYFHAVPSLANVAAQRVPVAWEEQLGKAVAERVARQSHICAETKRINYINQLFMRLVAAVPKNPYTFRLSVVDSPVLNAFAAPGGYIVVYKGLLQFTESPEELAGVLAHEIQHVTHRHVTRQILQQASLGVMLGAMTGDLNGAMVVGVQTASLLGGLSYSRAAEAEADQEARKLLVTAGINPHGMVTFFERLRKKSAATSSLSKYLSTHPALDDRINALEDATYREGASSLQLSPSVAWKEMADVCFVHSSVSS